MVCTFLFALIIPILVDSEMTEKNNMQKEEFEPLMLDYDGHSVKLSDPEESKTFYEKGFYGTIQEDGALMLNMVETLLMLERHRIYLLNPKTGNEYTFQELISVFVEQDENLWIKYIVYKDLRNRGYVVREGFTEGTYRVYERGAKVGTNTSKFLVSIVMEGIPVKLMELEQIVSSSKSMRKNLVLAVVDRQGEATYYKCSTVNL